ncbi:MAG: hypothetical protein K0R60_58 [Microbacterium sp.]|jgi:hypothetical protein|nr:hypothetical protein [Microbacterium sp.]
MSVAAKIPTKCPACEGWIEVGDFIKPDPLDGGKATWVHEHCPPGRMDLIREICPGCWTEKAVDGSCMCGDGS